MSCNLFQKLIYCLMLTKHLLIPKSKETLCHPLRLLSIMKMEEVELAHEQFDSDWVGVDPTAGGAPRNPFSGCTVSKTKSKISYMSYCIIFNRKSVFGCYLRKMTLKTVTDL